MKLVVSLFAVIVIVLPGCATLGQLKGFVQPPTFEQAPGRRAEIRLLQPAGNLPIGGAAVRLWTKVGNPNPFGLTLGTLKGALFLQDRHAADADFPLGLPLGARQDSVIPIDLSIDFSDLPGLATVVRAAAGTGGVPYRLEGTIGVDAGSVAKGLVFGPMTFLSGNLQLR